MTTSVDALALRDRAFATLRDIELYGVAELSDATGTPLHDAALALLPGARAIVVLGAEVYPEVHRLVEPARVMGEAAAHPSGGRQGGPAVRIPS